MPSHTAPRPFQLVLVVPVSPQISRSRFCVQLSMYEYQASYHLWRSINVSGVSKSHGHLVASTVRGHCLVDVTIDGHVETSGDLEVQHMSCCNVPLNIAQGCR